jgi:Spy/CpxP family protein refolding chaperone
MKKQILKKITVLTVAATLILVTCPAFSRAEGEYGEREMRRQEHKEKMMKKREEFIKELGLTPEQKKEMDRLREENKEKRKEIRQALKDKRKELHQELKLYNSDPRNIEAIVSEVKDLQGKLIDLRVKSILDTKKILTEEQFGKFTAKTKKTEKGRHRQMEKRNHRRW